jgi:hypothetical protein
MTVISVAGGHDACDRNEFQRQRQIQARLEAMRDRISEGTGMDAIMAEVTRVNSIDTELCFGNVIPAFGYIAHPKEWRIS